MSDRKQKARDAIDAAFEVAVAGLYSVLAREIATTTNSEAASSDKADVLERFEKGLAHQGVVYEAARASLDKVFA